MAIGDLAGRVALVTGGSGGIGRALVRRLAAAGADVAVAYGGDAAAAEESAAQARASGVRAIAAGADLADPGQVVALADRVAAECGPVDLLLANAGLSVPTPGLPELDLDTWQRTLAVNLTAPFLLAQRLVPDMADRGFGRVLFTSSVAAFTGGLIGPHYAASKAALHGLTAWLSARYAGSGVTVNALAPALVADTGMLPADADAGRIPVGRFGTADEVAELALTMLGSGYLTGKVYLLDGGLYPH
ncbi:SDR family NAD(P)-dependent oxidoreductase [Nakamurella endophytica]|uniref:3-oxoacyl-ACP reductase n=1 Tax=Nakamurella endophytica TaxID=1748367 RepID=A0A917SWI3_9ACTN|nr:SDR family NAD(P)-dependent oxidoreductase [Nakamurella endophytica]GGM02277.1 3-oxoacyl-ACP reductase [Nakamurella endophytica]